MMYLKDKLGWMLPCRRFYKCIVMAKICVSGILLFAFLASVGCRSTIVPPVPEARYDSRLRRLADDGQEQFAEGDVESAITNYRKAIRRAWALDDPAEIGNVAFNLAACLFSDGKNQEARDWLIESRCELARAGRSVGNTWLLESKIARSEGRTADAQEHIAMAQCTCPPCEVENKDGECCSSDDPCDQTTCATCLPCTGKDRGEQKRKENCVVAYTAQIQLAKARIANDFGDVVQASAHLQCARDAIDDSCQRDLASEVENVAGHIHLTREEPLQAGKHFDREADLLRVAGNLRQIPYALQLAAEAYNAAGRQDLAADRWCRAARVFHGRGDEKQAWKCVTSATQMATGVLITHPAVSQPVISQPTMWNTDIIETDLILFSGARSDTTNVIERRLAVVAREIKRALDAG
jgi:tetratricopeptide (TPR) repeat protein